MADCSSYARNYPHVRSAGGIAANWVIWCIWLGLLRHKALFLPSLYLYSALSSPGVWKAFYTTAIHAYFIWKCQNEFLLTLMWQKLCYFVCRIEAELMSYYQIKKLFFKNPNLFCNVSKKVDPLTFHLENTCSSLWAWHMVLTNRQTTFQRRRFSATQCENNTGCSSNDSDKNLTIFNFLSSLRVHVAVHELKISHAWISLGWRREIVASSHKFYKK